MNKQPVTLAQTLLFLQRDILRYTNGNAFVIFAKTMHNSGLFFSFLYRSERYFLYGPIFLKPLGLLLYPFYFFITYYVLDYHIEPSAGIGEGLFLHNKGIVITEAAVLGKNISIMDSVTIGVDFSRTQGVFKIGNNIKIGSGAKIIAKESLVIADNITIGANAVVVRSLLKKGGVYVGVPAKLIKK